MSSKRRRFFERLGELARDGSPEAAQALERIEARALDVLAMARGKAAILEGWARCDQDQEAQR